ncbi:MAG: ROK family protein [Deltaproteobacteria bacterium]|nr:ROK family protein [Deltaproteobacteria bacterium]
MPSTPPFRIGVDLGGTKIEGVVLDAGGEVVWRHRLPTESGLGYENILERIALVVDACRARAPECDRIGIGTPGSISSRTGLMKNSNTTCLNGRPLREDLERRLGLPVRLENDANLFALAEAVAGAARGAGLVFGVILGTGTGGGIVYRGELLCGLQHLAGEWGHHSIDPVGPACYCGQRGCVEAYIAGPAVERDYVRRGGAPSSVQEIVVAARNGEARAAQTFATFLDHFGRSLANLVTILDPDVIVLGGGLSNIDELYRSGRDAVARYVFNDELRTPIVRNQLGDSAGVIGAALLD